MNFIAFTGFLGSGKSLGASIFAQYYREKSGCALYSNCGVIGSKPFTCMDDFKKIALESSSILVLDEAHMDLDARSFSSNHVKFFTQVSYYLRKLRCTLILTTPNFSDLDSRIRGITNILAFVRNDSNYFYYEMYDVQSERYLRTYKIQKSNAFMVANKLYDTYSMVTPISIPSSKNDFTDFLEELKVLSENYYKNAVASL